MSEALKKSIGTGITKEDFIERMTRNREAFLDWYSRFEFPTSQDERFFSTFQPEKPIRASLLMADWCGDVVRNVPVLLHLLETANIPFEILVMEEHTDVMDDFLTLGGRSIPVLLFTDESGNLRGKWGPRPEHVQEVMASFLMKHPDRSSEEYKSGIGDVRKELISRYGVGTEYQAYIVKEIRELVTVLQGKHASS